MPWPLSQDYNEAVQTPLQSFTDADLKQAEAKGNAIGIPMPRSGNFADVYELTGPGGKKWAVKCFTRQVPGLRERYAAISAYLKQVNLPFMVDFAYLEQGVRIKGQWYPILKMDWVEGFGLNQFIQEHADNPPVLELLAQIWLRLAQRLREAKMAHADLQHGNVLLVPGSQARSLAVRLIDYDGMFVPALERTKSGEVGHPAYQHPQRLRDGTYNAEVDRFPHLVIYTALRSLMVGGRYLWKKYDNGDNLLFRQADLNDPGKSALFAELLRLNDPELRKLVQTLADSVQKPLDRTPLLEELMGSAPITAKRRPATGTVAAQQTTAAEAFAQATAGDVVRRPRRSARRSYVAVAVAGVAALAAVAVGGWLLATKNKPKETSPVVAVAVVPGTPKQVPSSRSLPKTVPETRKAPEPTKPPELKPEPTAPSTEDAWIRSVKNMDAPAQVQAVMSRLKELNPQFDGQCERAINNGQVRALRFVTDHVRDLAPLHALPALNSLNCSGSELGKGQISDLSPLRGMKLTVLECYYSRITDLSPLQGMPLTTLAIGGCQVSDLTPLAGMPLSALHCWANPIASLAPLKGLKLTTLNCSKTLVADLSPLQGMPLKELFCDFNRAHDLTIVRSLPTLATINGKPAGQFWKEHDAADPKTAGEFVTNSIGMKLAQVPAGSFWMGGGGGKPGIKQVTIPHDFYLGVHPVTQAQWQALMGNNPSFFSRTGGGKDKVTDIADTDLRQLPVERVSWDDAQQFIQKLNAREKDSDWVYRLPTEAEWEYACRGAPTSKEECAFHFYLDRPSNDLSSSQANFNGDSPAGKASKGPWLGRSTKVGSYPPNRLGLYDMHGNVRQLCQDAQGLQRVDRGGGWNGAADSCRAASRSTYPPSTRVYNVSFRLARVPSDNPTVKYLVDLQESDVKEHPNPLWRFQKGMAGSKVISVDGVSSPHGLCMHPTSKGFSSATYRIPKGSKRFQSGAAINDTAAQQTVRTPVTFQVFGDGRLLWESKPIQAAGQRQDCDVSLKGIAVLGLRVICPGPDTAAHAVWIEPLIKN